MRQNAVASALSKILLLKYGYLQNGAKYMLNYNKIAHMVCFYIYDATVAVYKKLWRVLLILLAITLSSSAIYAHDGEFPHLISVSGTAQKTYKPDKLDIYITLEGRDKQLAAAKKKHDDLLRSLHKITKKYKLLDADVKTVSNRIMPQYEYDAKLKKRVLSHYSASHQLKITLRDLEMVGSFINDITNAGIDRLQSMEFGITDKSTAEREVMLLAVNNAKQKALAIASSLGVKLKTVHSVTVGNTGYRTGPTPVAMGNKLFAVRAADSAMPAADIPLNDVVISSNVTTKFEIDNN